MIKGGGTIKSYFKSYRKDYETLVDKQIKNNINELITEYKEDLKDTLDVPPARTGLLYWIPLLRLFHRASAPGEAPAPMTRELINSITASTDFFSGANRGFVYTDKLYAVYLEEGTDTIAPRKGWNYTLMKHFDKYADIATQGFYRRSGV